EGGGSRVQTWQDLTPPPRAILHSLRVEACTRESWRGLHQLTKVLRFTVPWRICTTSVWRRIIYTRFGRSVEVGQPIYLSCTERWNSLTARVCVVGILTLRRLALSPPCLELQ
ncbi:unnamed protein product, partial [Ectocarpus sp. 8 AP-2014]